MRTIRIFDTTLRDGEQAAGGALTLEEKIEIGRQLQKLGVTVIEDRKGHETDVFKLKKAILAAQGMEIHGTLRTQAF